MMKTLKPQRLLSLSNHHPQPNFNTEHSINDSIITLCKHNLFHQALQAFTFLKTQKPHFKITPTTYTNLISACSSLKSLSFGCQVHHDILNRSNLQPDTILNNHIVNMYGKCGALDEAREVFDGMCERNVVSWGSMINGYMQNRRERDAVGLFFEMTRAGVWPDGYVFGSVVRACLGVNDFELGRQLHGNVVKSEFGGEVGSQNALVLLYTKFDRMESASVVFDRISKKDVISWGSIIAGFSQQGREVEALELFKEMLSVGIYRPNEFIFGSVFSACSGVLQLDIGRQIHGVSIKFGFGGDAYAGCSVSDMYAKCGSLDYAKIAFYQIENPDLVSWNAIIAAFSYSGVANETTLFFCQMRISGLIPDTISVRCLLSAFTSSSTLCQGQLVHSFVIKMGLDLDVPVSNTLLTMYTKCSDLSTAFKIFEEMRSRVDLVSWNAILTACLHHNQANKVFILLKMMLSSQYEPDHITLTTVLSACSVLASLKMVYQVHNYVVKTGFDTQITVTNSLIDIYTKCGALVNARKIFEFMKNPDVVSWSGLIVGLAQYGDAEEALKHFGKMRSIGVKPNHVTFVGVLTACSRVGLVEEGLDYYKTMEADYGILPTRDHCSCVVDLFARAGRLKEAEVFINQMPLNPDIVVWKTLLSACRTRGNLEIGKRAAESILNMDSSNSTAHVLLCNIYASLGRWDDVARFRKLMKSRNVMKIPGQSWIEVKEGVQLFSVEDNSHPKTNEIYTLLEELWLQMMEDGYIPDQRFTSIEPIA